MSDSAACSLIRSRRLIPVVRTETPELALRASEILVEAGIRILEITLTVPRALQCVETLAHQYGELVLVGAGTVLDVPSCHSAVNAGARFIVSPGFRPDVVAAARHSQVPVLPGALTPTEIMAAWEAGADFVKVFPCDAVGGPAYIKALRGPLPHIPLVPTGGVSVDTAAAFLQAGATALGVGGSLLPNAEMRAGEWNKIRERAARLVEVAESVGGGSEAP